MVLVQRRRERLQERLQKFPSYYVNVLSSLHTSIVVFLTNRGEVVAACGIQRPFNYFVIYVAERYRGRGLGTRVLKKTISVARKHNLSFINLNVLDENVPALRLYSKLGFREIVAFSRLKSRNMMLPLNFKGELAFRFLHKVCSLVPETLLFYILLFLKSVTKRIRHETVSLARGL